MREGNKQERNEMDAEDAGPPRAVAGGDNAGDKEMQEPAAEHSDEDEMCRYCFEGSEAGELISPCRCTGGQKYVHLACLRRWQRMVLVSQPTHPDMQRDDVRHHKCNVCTSAQILQSPLYSDLI